MYTWIRAHDVSSLVIWKNTGKGRNEANFFFFFQKILADRKFLFFF